MFFRASSLDRRHGATPRSPSPLPPPASVHPHLPRPLPSPTPPSPLPDELHTNPISRPELSFPIGFLWKPSRWSGTGVVLRVVPRSSSVCTRWAVGDKDAAAICSGFHRVTSRCVPVDLAASQPGAGLQAPAIRFASNSSLASATSYSSQIRLNSP
jgi:hypothetical protein